MPRGIPRRSNRTYRLRNTPAALGLGVNAGHDLSLDNIEYFIRRIPFTDEVSIGHALISEALYLGLENTIGAYRNKIRRAVEGAR